MAAALGPLQKVPIRHMKYAQYSLWLNKLFFISYFVVAQQKILFYDVTLITL